MNSRNRRILGLGAAAAFVVLPPYGDEPLAGIIGGKLAMEDTTSYTRERRRTGGGDNGVARWVGIIIIGSIVLLAVQVGGLRGFVQH